MHQEDIYLSTHEHSEHHADLVRLICKKEDTSPDLSYPLEFETEKQNITLNLFSSQESLTQMTGYDCVSVEVGTCLEHPCNRTPPDLDDLS